MIKLRDQKLAEAKVNNDIETWREYRSLRNRVKSQLSKDKKSFIKSQLEDEKSEKDKWSVTKNILGWTKNGSPALLIKDGKTITAPKDIAKEMNLALLSKVAKTVRSIKKNETDPLLNYAKVMSGKSCKLELKTISMSDLQKVLSNMKTSRSAGNDGISIQLIKQFKKELMGPILNLVNSSIRNNKYPTPLKQAKLLPLYKTSTPPNLWQTLIPIEELT